eukprot:6193631-Pleurochrysis_carterae.AAC.8
MLTCCLAFPTDELLKEAERVLIYLYNTRTLAILSYRSSMCGTPVRCNWAPTLGQVTDGDSDALLEADRSTSGCSFMLSNAASDSKGHEEAVVRCVVHVRGRGHGGLPYCVRGSLPAWPADRIGL